ncbi:lipid A export permease/ATP-binding protein MsbA [Sulfuriflexus sp.]|uniref:lipid A export permease/ATP-binding protein MsbA n=1 Tax=Sulfuriflexus sp. TaxID=2015443 RepID=UPI0028CD2D55|nr:lipid A export permease/ATP-binding protein MsbA [Sulfuriflexus sp.]MDT8405399.1 lipid A export permease/ATP-binding protein MsbA [Sulfuriflexus sp.]
MPDAVNKIGGKEAYRRLLTYVIPHWKMFIISVIGMAIFSGTDAAVAWLMKPLLDEGFIAEDVGVIRLMALGLVAIFLVRIFVGIISTYCMSWVGRRIIKDLRHDMFAHILRLPAAHYDQSSTGNTLSKLIFDVENVARASTSVVTVLIREGLTTVALLGLMFYRSWQLTLIFLLVTPLVAVLISYVSKKFRKTSKRIQDSIGGISHVAEEVIEGHRVVKTFGGQGVETASFEKENDYNRKQKLKLDVTRELSVGVIQFLVAMGIAGVILFTTSASMRGQVTPGDFVSMLFALVMLQRPIKRLTTVNSYLQTGIAAAQSIFSFIDIDKEKDTGTKLLQEVQGRVEYENVCFAYATSAHNVIDNISFVAESGQTVAFVGRSGSGKSTLVNLLPRFYDVASGSIRIDAQDIHDIKLDNLRSHIALVSQQVTLFNDTIAKNIAYGSLCDASEEDILRAAELAHAKEFIDKLPEGLNTLVGENGILLSGGQRQRLAIARALLKDAPILILDEATSALDTESERYIQAGLEELVKNRTTLVIAHRLSTIENADLIVVLDNGRIIEQGTHNELLARAGQYAALHKMQFRDE